MKITPLPIEQAIHFFVGQDETRPEFRNVQLWKGRPFATDGRVIVFADNLSKDGLIKTVIKVNNVMDFVAKPDGRLAYTADYLDKHITECECCKGTKKAKCEKCGQDCQCQDCDGIGYGSMTQSGIKIGSQLIAHYYAARLCLLDGMKIYPSDKYADKYEPIPFTFNGGDGVLMPLRQE